MLPIATNLAEVEGAIGSGNTALVNLLVEKFKDDIASDDQFIADRLDEGIMPDEDEADEEMGEPPSAVSIAELLRCLVMGEKPAGPVPYRYMYGCALRYLALHFGEVLPHDQWNDFSSGAFGTIDKAMGAAGISAKVLSLERLVDRARPIAAIPEYHDGLRVGYLRRLEIDQGLAALAAAKRDRMDEDLAVFVDDIHEWLRACADSKRDLLCFSTH